MTILDDMRTAVKAMPMFPREDPLTYFVGPNKWRYHRAEAIKTGVPFDCFGAQAIMLYPSFEIPR